MHTYPSGHRPARDDARSSSAPRSVQRQSPLICSDLRTCVACLGTFGRERRVFEFVEGVGTVCNRCFAEFGKEDGPCQP